MFFCLVHLFFFFFQAEDGIRDAQESRGLGDVYKRQVVMFELFCHYTSNGDGGMASMNHSQFRAFLKALGLKSQRFTVAHADLLFCLLYTSDAADEEDSVDLGGRRINKKKKKTMIQ
eukprot:TRINITY_DN12599_c0_g1_i2.p1 TRINITY_DN12599_c0_g1~~TRINITY_DN12599_c0_g1_i2.p1  ORF type:complete len:117 (-),score=49.09 TRINITY_DN12599_c0_g1_i2:41-391(-)